MHTLSQKENPSPWQFLLVDPIIILKEINYGEYLSNRKLAWREDKYFEFFYNLRRLTFAPNIDAYIYIDNSDIQR